MTDNSDFWAQRGPFSLTNDYTARGTGLETTSWNLNQSNGNLEYAETAVPEPAAAGFLLTGLAMLAAVGGRLRR